MKAMARIAGLRQRLSSANRALEDLASRDGLTGICNRRNMDLRVDVAWAEAVRLAQPFGLLMLDIDNFKKYNDHYGHPAGDECLRAVAKALAEMIEASNRQGLSTDALVARYGGEEFTVVLPGATREAYALIGQRAVAVIAGLGIPHIPNQPWGVVTTSIGGAHTQSATEKVAALFRCADEKLYAAKAAGRNQLAAA